MPKSTAGTTAGDAYAVGADSEIVTSKADLRTLRSQGSNEAVWRHTLQAFRGYHVVRKLQGVVAILQDIAIMGQQSR